MTVSARTEAEMRRGRAIGQKKERQADLDRYVYRRLVKIRTYRRDLRHAPGIGGVDYMHEFYVDGVKVAQECVSDPEYPSEKVMAALSIAFMATGKNTGVRERTNGPNPGYRQYVKGWSDDE